MRRPLTALALLAIAAVALLALAGCAGSALPKPTVGQNEAASIAPAVEPAPLKLMTPDEKQSFVASSFPMQVPVPKGEVRRGEAQGDSAWVYQIYLPFPEAASMQWYRNAYANAEWTIAGQTANTLAFAKNGAQTKLEFQAGSGGAGTTLVTGAVGVGTQIFQTQ